MQNFLCLGFNNITMKINSFGGLKTALGVALTAGTLAVSAQTPKPKPPAPKLTEDVFVKEDVVPPKGTTNDTLLFEAPSPVVFVTGERRTAAIVVDLSKNILYKYDEDGEPEIAYSVASGKKRTPTDTGLRIVTNVEKYPYKSAPPSTKRHRQPWNYGPRTIILEKLDPKTGNTAKTGEFIHGNNNPKSIGQYASLGCIRMDNEVIKVLASQVKRGDLVLITK